MQPDVLLITIDCLRYDAVRGQMPYLTELSERPGALSTHIYNTSSWTGMSLASLMTGLFPRNHGLWYHKLPGSKKIFKQEGTFQTSLTDDLRAGGYFTCCFHTNSPAGALDRLISDFDFSDEVGRTVSARTGREARLRFLRTLRPLHALELASKTVLHKATTLLEGCHPEQSRSLEFLRLRGRSEGRYLVDRYLRHVRERVPSKPLFTWLHFMDLHDPYLPPLKRFPLGPRKHMRPFVDPFGFSAGDREATRRRYAACARYEDRLVKRLIRNYMQLRKRPVLCVITADHGEEFWDHGQSDRPGDYYTRGTSHGHTLYNELIRVPLIVFGRSVPCHFQKHVLASCVDFRSSLLAALGLPVPEGLDGRDLAAEDLGREFIPAEHIYWGPERKAIITRRHKMIARREKRDCEIYDMQDDPAERHNLADREDPELRRLRALWREQFAGADWRPSNVEEEAGKLENLRALGYC